MKLESLKTEVKKISIAGWNIGMWGKSGCGKNQRKNARKGNI